MNSTNDNPPPAGSSATTLSSLDEELARQAEQTLKLGDDDGSFDLEGEFLSQEQIALLMSSQSGGEPAPADAPAQPDPGDELPAEPVGAVLAGDEAEELAAGPADYPEEVAPPAPPLKVVAAEAEMGGQVGHDLVVEPDIGEDRLLESVSAAIPAGGMVRWQRAVVAAATFLDRPWVSLSRRAKHVLGIAGAVLLIVGLVLWMS